ncbi:hypothetical protein H1P_1410025 [Hyella patelloides LEGE 07179]|uniref:Uncharacterized protein n=1 Tax=Hyella patelloides LEGE 07179 TaxID=945734 RepID=A0A563VLI4_9CYAN|nr:hypothetical protein H1P_1410025 [Hyella patelloides LEGE 07179]
MMETDRVKRSPLIKWHIHQKAALIVREIEDLLKLYVYNQLSLFSFVSGGHLLMPTYLNLSIYPVANPKINEFYLLTLRLIENFWLFFPPQHK